MSVCRESAEVRWVPQAVVGSGRCGCGSGAGCEYMGCTRGSGVVSTSDDVLEMSVVRGVRGVCGMCEMCVFATGGVGGLGVSE